MTVNPPEESVGGVRPKDIGNSYPKDIRGGIFKSEGARTAFEKCLFEACEKSEWVLHAFVVMGNHYHLAIETPKANLVAGMTWLQTTFAVRFNRKRKENGPLF